MRLALKSGESKQVHISKRRKFWARSPRMFQSKLLQSTFRWIQHNFQIADSLNYLKQTFSVRSCIRICFWTLRGQQPASRVSKLAWVNSQKYTTDGTYICVLNSAANDWRSGGNTSHLFIWRNTKGVTTQWNQCQPIRRNCDYKHHHAKPTRSKEGETPS